MADQCRWVKNADAPGGRVLIPGCMGVAAHWSSPNAMDYCTCTRVSDSEKIDQLRRDVDRMKKELRELRKDTPDE